MRWKWGKRSPEEGIQISCDLANLDLLLKHSQWPQLVATNMNKNKMQIKSFTMAGFLGVFFKTMWMCLNSGSLSAHSPCLTCSSPQKTRPIGVSCSRGASRTPAVRPRTNTDCCPLSHCSLSVRFAACFYVILQTRRPAAPCGQCLQLEISWDYLFFIEQKF